MVSHNVKTQYRSPALTTYCEQVFNKRRLILASNRGPAEFHTAEDGRLVARRGSGGVVTALGAVSQYSEMTWIASAMSEGDRKAAAKDGRLKSPLIGQNIHIRFVVTPRDVYHKYYNIFCNPLLWFLQHYMWDSPRTPNITATVADAWRNGYRVVNEAFAKAIAAEASADSRPSLVMIHDYQLYLVAGAVRRSLPDILLQHFIHIPWPAPGYWHLLPGYMRQEIFLSLCANDIVGLQTTRDARNFLHTCEAFLPDAQVDYRERSVVLNGHRTLVRSYPISVDVGELRRMVTSGRVREYEAKLRPYMGEKTIVRVDRAEPSKNILRGFLAFELMLERHPELAEKVRFLAFLVPSRTHIRQYQRYTEDINKLVERINSRFGQEGAPIIKIFYENNYPQAIAGMKLYDVLLVNAVIDGMNLVAKEGPIVNQGDGVMVLSESVGAYEQLGEGVLPVGPADIDGTANALYEALTMPQEERANRAQLLREIVEQNDLPAWVCQQMSDLDALTGAATEAAS